ncbi:MAG: hypothetical protein EZS28_045870, partial [Streblomastix strix]
VIKKKGTTKRHNAVMEMNADRW